MEASETYRGLTPVERYTRRVAVFAEEQVELARFSLRYTIARGLVFLLGLATLTLGAAQADYRIVWWITSGVVFVAFIAVVMMHDRLAERMRVAREQEAINREALARIERRWNEFPVPEVARPEPHDAEIRDLDVLGKASLFHLVCRANTPLGMRTLRDWLLDPADPDVVVERQDAVRQLTPLWQWREQLQLRGRLLAMGRQGPDALLQWAESARWLEHRKGLQLLIWLLPPTLVILAVLTLTHVLPLWLGATMLVGVVAVNSLLSILYAGTLHDIFERVSSRNNEAQIYGHMFALMSSVPEAGPLLIDLKQRAGGGDDGACDRLMQLNRLVGASNLRRSGLMTFLYVIVQVAVLWDFHVLWFLERWHRQWSGRVREWLTALGHLEALASLAGLAEDHPDWVMPQLQSEPVKLEAKQVGHPLIPAGARVSNDVKVGPPGSFLLVTGSNMSGKSTLLRSLGTNVLLAQAGGPVCAREFRLAPLEVATSMRVQDSLQDGVSFFMAELKRLKQIVDRAAQLHETDAVRAGTDTATRRTLLYLLDEILQGTNSVERHIAVQRVIRHLLAHDAIGAVSTHDLELASSPSLVDRCENVHFRESFEDTDEGRRMTFDYQLRDGVASTTNALKLLELVGIADPPNAEDDR